MTEEQLKSDIKAAMIAKDELTLRVLRMVSAATTNRKKEKGNEEISEEEIMDILQRQVKQRKDSIDGFEKGGRPEAAEEERREIEVLKNYLPAELANEEIEKVVLSKKEALGITDKSGIGQLMGACMGELKSKGVDGARVKEIVEKVLS